MAVAHAVLIVDTEPNLRRWIGPLSTLLKPGEPTQEIELAVRRSSQTFMTGTIKFILHHEQLLFDSDGACLREFLTYSPTARLDRLLLEKLEFDLACNQYWRCLSDQTVTNKLFGVRQL